MTCALQPSPGCLEVLHLASHIELSLRHQCCRSTSSTCADKTVECVAGAFSCRPHTRSGRLMHELTFLLLDHEGGTLRSELDPSCVAVRRHVLVSLATTAQNGSLIEPTEALHHIIPSAPQCPVDNVDTSTTPFREFKKRTGHSTDTTSAFKLSAAFAPCSPCVHRGGSARSCTGALLSFIGVSGLAFLSAPRHVEVSRVHLLQTLQASVSNSHNVVSRNSLFGAIGVTVIHSFTPNFFHHNFFLGFVLQFFL